VTDDQSRALRNVVYRTPGDEWTAPRLEMERRKDKRASDFPGPISYCPVLSLRAWECLSALIGPCVEPLPLTCRGAGYVLLNVLTRCPAFDEGRSKGVRRDEWTGLYGVFEYAFFPGVKIEADMFLISTGLGRVFVTERFRQVVEQNGLVGLLWPEVPLVRS
jgi:hypothetical protein